MYNTFLNAFKVKSTYRANSILYYLTRFPVLGKHISPSVYSASTMKEFVMAVSIVIEVLATFLGKALYVLLLGGVSYLWTSTIEEWNSTATFPMTFLNMFFYLTLAGGWVNSYLLEMRQDNYYCIMLMRMEARKLAISQFLYFLVRSYIGNLVVVYIMGIIVGIPTSICLVLPIFIVTVKISGAALRIRLYAKKKVLRNFQKMAIKECLISLVLLIPALGLVVVDWGITYTGIYCGTIIAIVFSFFAMRYIWTCSEYNRIYRRIMAESDILVDRKKTQANMVKESLGKQIDTVDTTEVKKQGYAYLNEIFIRRHRKMLKRAVHIFAIIELGVFTLLLVLTLYIPEVKQAVNLRIINTLPTCLFIMYICNRGAYISKAMFTNCDFQMLSYRFYKQPEAILGLFKERLKSIVKLDLSHSLIIAIGMPILLAVSGGTNNPIEYLMLFISVVAMSVFFSVHNLVIYYVFQPYNKDIEMKNPIYMVINMVVYFVCISFNAKSLSIYTFGTGIICFSIIYVLVALLLAYRLAPKTFKLR